MEKAYKSPPPVVVEAPKSGLDCVWVEAPDRPEKRPPPVPLCVVLFPPPSPENRPDVCGCEVAVVELPNRPPPPPLVVVFCCPPRDVNIFVLEDCVVAPVFPNNPPDGLDCVFDPRLEKRPPVLPDVFAVAGVDREGEACVFVLPLSDAIAS